MKKFKIISIFLILIGVTIISYTFIAKYVSIKKQNDITKNYEKKLEFSKTLAEPVNSNNADNASHLDEKGTIGILVIDKIDLKVAVNEGTDDTTLKYSVGHFKDTALPGEKGNFSVAGHRNYTYGEYFNRLDELEKGDEIVVKTIKGTFKYTVFNKKVVLPDQVEVLNPTKDATMTLITCTPIRKATHRLIVNAKLIP